MSNLLSLEDINSRLDELDQTVKDLEAEKKQMIETEKKEMRESTEAYHKWKRKK